MGTQSSTQPTMERRAARRPVLVFFGSSRSGPCRRVEAFLDQVLQARRNHDTFTRRVVDVENQPRLAERFGVNDLPTIVVIDRGQVAARLEGRVGVSQLRDALSPWLR